eukprot:13611030-Alexandrium_andersonii.AAC.1
MHRPLASNLRRQSTATNGDFSEDNCPISSSSPGAAEGSKRSPACRPKRGTGAKTARPLNPEGRLSQRSWPEWRMGDLSCS